MTNDPFDKPYAWYQDLFCRDLLLCNRSEQDWGFINYDKDRVGAIALYYLENLHYSRVGREMLVESLMASINARLTIGPGLSDPDHLAVVRAVHTAINDPYDRDSVAHYWSLEDKSTDPNPLFHWLRRHFSNWIPPPSVWESSE